MQRFMRNSALWFGVGKTGKGRETENLMNISSRLAMIALVSGAVWTTQPASAQTTIIQQQPSTAPSGAATVRITPEQRTVIKKRIGTKHPSTTVKQRATVGTTLPANVELTPLPDEIYTEVPSIKNYRYVVVGDEIVLVEPQTRRVIEVFPE